MKPRVETITAQRIRLGQKLAQGRITRAEYDRRYDELDREEFGEPQRDGRTKEKPAHA